MTAEELETLIASGEGETLEVKETTGQRVDACETHREHERTAKSRHCEGDVCKKDA